MKQRNEFAVIILGCVIQSAIISGCRASPAATEPARDSTGDEWFNEVLKGHFDARTPRGAVLGLAQSFLRKDSEAMGRAYFAEGDPGQKLAMANAQRILCSVHFADAVPPRFHFSAEELTMPAGLIADSDAVWYSDQITMAGGTASVLMPDGTGVPLRRVGQFWRIDITPKLPETAGHLAAMMDENTNKLKQIIANLGAENSTIGSVADLCHVFASAHFSSVVGALRKDQRRTDKGP